jgi:hypothetical protein
LEYTLARKQPEVLGQVCQEFYLLQHQIGFNISDFANVAYFKFENRWVRLYFEPNTIFWGEHESPQEPENSGLESMLVLVNLNEMSGIVGFTLESIEYGVKGGNVFASINFEGGKCLVFSHDSETDTTSVRC